MRSPHKGAPTGIALLLGNLSRSDESGAAVYADVKSLADVLEVELRDSRAIALSAELPVWCEIVIGYVAARTLIGDIAKIRELVARYLAVRSHCPRTHLKYHDGRTLHVVIEPDEQALAVFPQLVQATQIWAALMPELATSGSVGWKSTGSDWRPMWCAVDASGVGGERVPSDAFADTARYMRGTPGVDVDVFAYSSEQLLALIETSRDRIAKALADPTRTFIDPDAVFYALVSFQRARAAAIHRMPLLGEVHSRPVPPVSGTAHHEGRGHFKRSALERFVEDADALRRLWPAATSAKNLAKETAMSDSSTGDARAVFVVHGRNYAAREAMFTFLRSLDLRPIEWSEARRATESASPYIYDVLLAGLAMARAVVVLVTPDEEARLAEPLRNEPGDAELVYQSRPNVLFEAGMAFATARERTLIVEFRRSLTASDLDGINVVRIDDDATSAIRREIAERLRSAGCAVNDSGTDWLNAGDFARATAREK